MRYEVLALDLDGTLTNKDKKITPKTKSTILKAIQKGVIIVLASGRPVLGIQNIVKELCLQEIGGYVLAYNGGLIVNCKTGEKVFSAEIEQELYSEICLCAYENNLTALTYDDNGIITENGEDIYVKKEAFNNNIPIRQVEHLPSEIHRTVVKFMMVGNPQHIEHTLPRLQQQFKGRLSIFCSEPYFVEVMPLGIEKAFAMDKLMNHLKISHRSLIACGDGLNDITMLQYAGLGVAMENACDEVKAVSQYVTDSNNMDGVAKVIERFFNIK